MSDVQRNRHITVCVFVLRSPISITWPRMYAFRRFQSKLRSALSEVELTKTADDPFVHFGDVVQVG